MSAHTCHRPGCDTHVLPKMFACRSDWFSLPKPYRDAIWAEYRPGQERDKHPSAAYLQAAMDALGYWQEQPK